MSEPILIPIKASEELPKEEGVYFVDMIIDNPQTIGFDTWRYIPRIDDRAWMENIRYWYKPVSEDEYKKEIIIDLLNNHLDTWEYANCGNVEEVAQEYINYIKSKLTEK